LGEKQKALGYYEQALPLRRAVGDRGGEATTLSNYASIWQQTNPSLAVWFGKLALMVSQSLRKDVRGMSLEQRRSLDQQFAPYFTFTADKLLRLGRAEEAQQSLDLLKAAESFVYGKTDSLNYLDRRLALTTREQTAVDEYEKQSGKIEALGMERSQLNVKSPRTDAGDSRIAEIDRALDEAGQWLRDWLKDLEVSFRSKPEGRDPALRLPEVERLRETLRQLGPQSAALYALATEDSYFAMLISADSHQVFQVDMAQKVLSGKIEAFRKVLQNPGLDPMPLAQELYRSAIPVELRKELDRRGIKHLMWSLDGRLRYLPVGALHDGERYLASIYTHSTFAPANEDRLLAAVPRDWKGVGFGASDGAPGYSPLPSVKEELLGIFSMKAGDRPVQGQEFLNKQFTRKSLLEHACKCNVVHIASHFASRSGEPENSKLLLGDGSEISLADLEAVPGLFTGVDLLTLSACETALGNQTGDGREVDSIANIMQRLGAKAVLASLWSVNDQSTALFMQEFYKVRQANAGMTKAEALQRAQLGMLEGKVRGKGCGAQRMGSEQKEAGTAPGYLCDGERPYAHPYYWAPFVLMGNWK